MLVTTKTTTDALGTITLTEETVAPAPASSVEITMDSKGIARPTVKVYHEDPAHAARTAMYLYQELCRDLAADTE